MINSVFTKLWRRNTEQDKCKKEQQLALLPYKSIAVALLFAIIFGPIGLLYASTRAGIIMMLIGSIVLGSHFLGPIVLFWLISCIWSVVASHNYNLTIINARINTKYEHQHSSTSATA